MKIMIKYAAAIILFVIGLACSIFAMNSIACISAPKVYDDEPEICRDAKYIAYAFHQSKDKIPETVISNGLASCRNVYIWIFCRDDILKEEKTRNMSALEKELHFNKCTLSLKQQ